VHALRAVLVDGRVPETALNPDAALGTLRA
jgi:hypothetical protein